MADEQAAPVVAPVVESQVADATEAPLPEWGEVKKAAIGEDEKPAKAKGKDKAADAAPEEQTRDVRSDEWARYKKKNKAINAREETLKTREAEFSHKYENGRRELAALEKRNTELEARSKQLEQMEADPKAFVEHFSKKLGISPAKIINLMNDWALTGKTPTDLEVDKLKAQLKADQEEKAANAEKSAKAAEAAKIDGYKDSIAKHVTANADNWDFISTYPPEAVAAAAWDRIAKHHARTGESLPLDKVLKTLESEEEALYLQKEARRKKRQLSVAETTQNPLREGETAKVVLDEAQRPQTLTHRLATQRTNGTRELSEAEAWKESKRIAGLT